MVLKAVEGTGKPEFEQRIASMVQETKGKYILDSPAG
jgi:hypothetical protein